jgi:hypothetical protein
VASCQYWNRLRIHLNANGLTAPCCFCLALVASFDTPANQCFSRSGCESKRANSGCAWQLLDPFRKVGDSWLQVWLIRAVAGAMRTLDGIKRGRGLPALLGGFLSTLSSSCQLCRRKNALNDPCAVFWRFQRGPPIENRRWPLEPGLKPTYIFSDVGLAA